MSAADETTGRLVELIARLLRTADLEQSGNDDGLAGGLHPDHIADIREAAAALTRLEEQKALLITAGSEFAAQLEAAEAKVAELTRERDEARAQFERALDTGLEKIMAASDERISALLRMEGSDPDDVAKLADQACQIGLLKHDLTAALQREGDMRKALKPFAAGFPNTDRRDYLRAAEVLGALTPEPKP